MSLKLIVVCVCALTILLFLLYVSYRAGRQFSQIYNGVQNFIIWKKALGILKIHKFKTADHQDTCPICLVSFSHGTKVRTLTCGHDFHPKCIDHWIQKHQPTCPICNETVPLPRTENKRPCSICSPISVSTDAAIGNHGSEETIIMDDDNVITGPGDLEEHMSSSAFQLEGDSAMTSVEDV